MHPEATIFHLGNLSSIKSFAAALCRLKCGLCCILSCYMESVICVNPTQACTDFKGLELHWSWNGITTWTWFTPVLVFIQHKEYSSCIAMIWFHLIYKNKFVSIKFKGRALLCWSKGHRIRCGENPILVIIVKIIKIICHKNLHLLICTKLVPSWHKIVKKTSVIFPLLFPSDQG